jgi:hypothetical protein
MYRNCLAAISVHLFVIIILNLIISNITEAFSDIFERIKSISRTYSSIIKSRDIEEKFVTERKCQLYIHFSIKAYNCHIHIKTHT